MRQRRATQTRAGSREQRGPLEGAIAHALRCMLRPTGTLRAAAVVVEAAPVRWGPALRLCARVAAMQC